MSPAVGMTVAGGVTIRPGRMEDLPAIDRCYEPYVRTTGITFDFEPYTPEARRQWFDQFAQEGPHRLFVALTSTSVTSTSEFAGFAYSARFRPKAGYSSSVETTIYLAQEAVGRGIGSRLYGALFDALAGLGLHRAYAGVALPNPASVALHRRFGFRSIGVFREVGHKFGRFWDVEWFEKELE